MFRYRITENDYLKMAKWLLLKQRGPKKKAVPKLLLKTVVQMAAVAGLIFLYPDVQPWLRTVLIAASLIWASLALFQYFFLDVRANMLLINAKRDARAQDYWKEHCLKRDGDRLVLTYGEVELELPVKEITSLEEAEDLTMILRGRDVFESLPQSVTKTEKWAAFAETLFEKKEEAIRSNQDQMEAALLAQAAFSAWVDMTREEMAEKLALAKRQSFRYACGWSWRTGFTLLFPLALGIYAACYQSWATVALCLVTFVLFNLRFFSVFTPAYQAMLAEKLPPPTEKGYLFAVHDQSIWMVTAVRTVKYMISTLKKTVRTEGGVFLYFERQVMLYVPDQIADAFLRAVYGKKSLREKAAGMAPEEEE